MADDLLGFSVTGSSDRGMKGRTSGEAGSYKINYDPLVMADGIAPTDDPVLLIRSPSYATTYTRRLRDL